MVLYLVGLGLGDLKDITMKGLEIVKKAHHVFLESYTSLISNCSQDEMEQFYGKKVVLADRDMVEQNADDILHEAKDGDVAFLVVGDPLGATTHTDLILRAVELEIQYEIVHNASIMNAIAACGLQLYQFGETVSVVFWTDSWQPDSYYDKIEANRLRGLHTLCLLDIKVKEQSIENLMKGKKVYEPPRFMSVNDAATQLLQILEHRKDRCKNFQPAYLPHTSCVGLARIGTSHQQIVVCTLTEMSSQDLGPPLHSLIIPGHIHPLESAMLKLFKSKNSLVELEPAANLK